MAIDVEIASALAFETVTVELFDATGGAKLATATACANKGSPETTGEYALCLQQTLTPGSSHTLHVTPTGDADCAGSCAFNRYRMTATTMR